MLCGMTEESSKARAFATFAGGHGWKAEVRRITHRDYPDKQDRQIGWTVIAARLRSLPVDLEHIGVIGQSRRSVRIAQ